MKTIIEVNAAYEMVSVETVATRSILMSVQGFIGSRVGMSAADARQVARALLAAADEIEPPTTGDDSHG